MLAISSLTFIIATVVLYALQALLHDRIVLQIVFLTVPLVFVSLVLIYSVCRIQEEVRHIGVDIY